MTAAATASVSAPTPSASAAASQSPREVLSRFQSALEQVQREMHQLFLLVNKSPVDASSPAEIDQQKAHVLSKLQQLESVCADSQSVFPLGCARLLETPFTPAVAGKGSSGAKSYSASMESIAAITKNAQLQNEALDAALSKATHRSSAVSQSPALS
eukprot:ANDGO_04261.mRNA.1 hypothetical protein